MLSNTPTCCIQLCLSYDRYPRNYLHQGKARRYCATYCGPMASSSKHKSASCRLLFTSSLLYIQENSSQLGNLAAGATKALPPPKKASKKDSRPKCLDGLWEILQHAEELLQSQPDVMAHTLRLLAVMWQVLFPVPPYQQHICARVITISCIICV